MDGRFDLASLAEVIKSAGVDIVGLQEVDYCTTRSHGVDQSKEIANHLSFQQVFGMHFPYKGGEYGVAVLSRYPIIHSEQFALPTISTCEPRTLLQAVVDIDGVVVDIFNTHLEVRNKEIREEQCDAAAAIIEQSKRPIVLMGDMNAIPGNWDLNGRLSRFLWDTDANANSCTYPSGNPRKRIDYILCSTHWSAKGPQHVVEVVDTPSSDHVMICAPLLLTGV
jgi:endonuclease/exonuclease/phosphatase family metal-dependent hydrolase